MTEADPTHVPPVQPPLVDFTEPEKPVDDAVAPMPVWASILVILLSLSAGGWIVKWYVGTDMLQHESKVLDENPPAATPRGGGGYTGPAVRTGNNATIIHCPEAELTVATPQHRAAFVRSIVYNSYPFVGPDVIRTRTDARRILNDGQTQKFLGMTPEQVSKLRASLSPITMATASGDLDRLLKLYDAYEGAKDKAAPLAALQAAMTEIARKSLAPTKILAVEKTAKTRAVLTADQWSKYETMGR